MVPLSERPKTHQHIANWLASRSAVEEAKAADIAELTTHHFRQMGDDEAAHPHLLNAALSAAQEGSVLRCSRPSSTLDVSAALSTRKAPSLTFR